MIGGYEGLKREIWILLFAVMFGGVSYLTLIMVEENIKVIPAEQYVSEGFTAKDIRKMRESGSTKKELYEVYKDLTVIDVHNHDVSLLHQTETRGGDSTSTTIDTWEKYGIDKTVLFGDVSEPSAIRTDRLVWTYYQQYPKAIYPSFAGVPLKEDQNGMEIVKEKLEKGYVNIGEIYAASTYSNNANVLWKGDHPYDGVLPEIYEIAAQYQVPILLHIDPPRGKPMNFLKVALRNHPDTIFIFAHGNVFTTPNYLKSLLAQHDNLYIDFFAGFTRYNKQSGHTLAEFIPVMEEYPERFFLGSDSGYEIGTDQTYKAMYEVIDKLSPSTALKVAYQNYETIIEKQPPTDYQINKIKELASQIETSKTTYKLNKRAANEIIFELQEKVNK